MKITVIGAGDSGLGMAAHLIHSGHAVTLWNRSADRIEPFIQGKAIAASGAIEGDFLPSSVTNDIQQAIADTDLIIVTTPAFAHRDIAIQLQSMNGPLPDILLSPGRTLGAYLFSKYMEGVKTGSIVEAQTVIHACRVRDGTAHVFSIKNRVPITAPRPHSAHQFWERLPPSLAQIYHPADSYLATTFGNVGPLLHCVPMLLNTGWVESKTSVFNFYRDGISPRIAELIEELDNERIRVAGALGFSIPNMRDWLHLSYGIRPGSLYDMLQNNMAYQFIDAPNCMTHRYISEDVPTGLVPLEALAQQQSIYTPLCTLLIDLASQVMSVDYRASFPEIDLEELL